MKNLRTLIFSNWQILSLILIILGIFALFYGHFGDIIFDSYREVYISTQVSEGQALYKDIFMIYAPLSYLINALLVKIIGAKLLVFYFAGLLCTCTITATFFKISNFFFSKNTSFVLGLAFIACSVLSPNVFNTFLPYSYGILYGLAFILLAIYFMLKKQYPLAYFLYSLAVLSKYEFILVLAGMIFLSRKEKFIQNFITFSIPAFVVSIILYLQGVRLIDLLAAFNLVLIMGQTESLKVFYYNNGLVPSIGHIKFYLINLAKFFIPVCIIEYFKKYRYILSGLLIIFLLFSVYQTIFMWLVPFVLLGFILQYKKLNINEKFLIICAILSSLKVFMALNLQSYGVYFLPLMLIAFLIVIPEKYRKSVLIVILIWSFMAAVQQIRMLELKSSAINTSVGKACVSKLLSKDINRAIEYIGQNVAKDETVVVFPEFLSINVLSNRQSDNKIYSLIPLYIETMGEDNIVNYLELNKPNYIMLSNYSTLMYGSRFFGHNYAQLIKRKIDETYDFVQIIGKNCKFEIYKLKTN